MRGAIIRHEKVSAGKLEIIGCLIQSKRESASDLQREYHANRRIQVLPNCAWPAPKLRTPHDTRSASDLVSHFALLIADQTATEDWSQGRAQRAVRDAFTPVRHSGYRHWRGRSDAPAGERDWCEVSKTGVGSVFVVLSPEGGGLFPRFEKVPEPTDVEELIAQLSVEAFHSAVLHRAARLDVKQFNTIRQAPGKEVHRIRRGTPRSAMIFSKEHDSHVGLRSWYRLRVPGTLAYGRPPRSATVCAGLWQWHRKQSPRPTVQPTSRGKWE